MVLEMNGNSEIQDNKNGYILKDNTQTEINEIIREFPKVKYQLNNLANNYDSLNKNVLKLAMDIPNLLSNQTRDITTNVRQQFEDCRKIQGIQNQEKFIKMPESFWSKIAYYIITALIFLGGFLGIEQFFK